VADFGFAAPVQGRTGTGFLLTKLGTKNYMAPELLARQAYQGHVVDLFALGIILFILYTG
jgi:serine/threonine protein kinase